MRSFHPRKYRWFSHTSHCTSMLGMAPATDGRFGLSGLMAAACTRSASVDTLGVGGGGGGGWAPLAAGETASAGALLLSRRGAGESGAAWSRVDGVPAMFIFMEAICISRSAVCLRGQTST